MYLNYLQVISVVKRLAAKTAIISESVPVSTRSSGSPLSSWWSSSKKIC